LCFRQEGRKKEKDQISPPVYFEKNSNKPVLCIAHTFSIYYALTKDQRVTPAAKKFLFLSTTSPDVLKDATIGNRCHHHMEKAGVDKKYAQHSIRMAAACFLLDKGLSIEEVMRIGDWSSPRVFLHFYH